MTRKRLAILGLVLLVAVVATVGTLAWALFSTPDFYEELLAEEIPEKVRVEKARVFLERTKHLAEAIKTEDEWSEEFTQLQINSWLSEDYEEKSKEWKTTDVEKPRVKLQQDSVLLGFYYKQKGFNGIVSVQVKPSLQGDRHLALEIESLRVGLVSIPKEKVLDQITDQATRKGWNIEWTQKNGHDVAVIELKKKFKDQPVQLKDIKVIDGKLQIFGQRDEESPKKPISAALLDLRVTL